jgi:hypothetical protein
MANLAILTHAIDVELRHTLQESEHSNRNNPRGYAAGFDAGRADALRWLLQQVASALPADMPPREEAPARA